MDFERIFQAQIIQDQQISWSENVEFSGPAFPWVFTSPLSIPFFLCSSHNLKSDIYDLKLYELVNIFQGIMNPGLNWKIQKETTKYRRLMFSCDLEFFNEYMSLHCAHLYM